MVRSFLMLFMFSCFASYEVQEMTLEEKVGQLLMIQFNGEMVNEEAVTLVNRLHVGGIIYYNWSNGLTSPEQVLGLSVGLQNLSAQNRLAIPLLIAADQEGGLVARLTRGFTVFPGNKALGMTGEPTLAEEAACAMGQELRAVGVNCNLAPVVDVNSNPRNPVIGIRAFGDSADIVIPFAKHALDGYHAAGVITSLKHFPGHGDVEVDSHEDLPVIFKSKQQLQALEFLPFAALADQADMVMTAHVMVPSIDPIHCATFSKSILDILRNEMGFKGVIITDSLVMDGALKNKRSVNDAAMDALNAGCDILLLGGKQLIHGHMRMALTAEDVARIHQSLVQAVKEGLVSEDRLNEAVQRILLLKQKYDLSALDTLDRSKESLSLLVNTAPHHQLAEHIASLALKVEGEKQVFLKPLQQCKLVVMAPEMVRENVNQTSLMKLGGENVSLFFNGLNPTAKEVQEAMERAQEADCILFCAYNAWKNPSQEALVHSLCELNKPVIVMVLRDPLDAVLFPHAALILTTFGPTAPSIRAACLSIQLSNHRILFQP